MMSYGDSFTTGRHVYRINLMHGTPALYERGSQIVILHMFHIALPIVKTRAKLLRYVSDSLVKGHDIYGKNVAMWIRLEMISQGG